MKPVRLVVFMLLFLAVSCFSLAAGDGYTVKFRVKGVKDTTCLIANYYGNNTYVKDTLRVDGSGHFTFKAPEDLPRGIYIVVLTDRNYFEFVMNNDHKFSMETDKADLQGKMAITGSPENTLFYNYLAYNQEKYKDIKVLQDKEKELKDNKDSLKVIEEKIGAINATIIKYKLDIAEKHPDSFMALMINAMKEPDIPEIPTLPNGRKDSAYVYRYVKEHFWDGTNFTDDRLLRTPVFYNKLKKYFDNVIIQTPDTIIRESDMLIERSRPNHEMFKYLVWFVTNHYENSEIMGFDRIFVHVVDTYYATGQADWVNKTVLESILKKANRIRPLLIGEKAPNMIMMDTNNQLVSMQSVKANFLLILFWDPDCGHCEQEIPKLKEFYDKNKETFGLEIFSVCSDTSLVKWKKAIIKRKMNWINVDGPRTLTGNYHDQYDVTTTPIIYLLNQRKEIIAKQLKTEQIEQFLKNYIRIQEKKKETEGK
jgi:thiol-disulfide isomerase/thioredoxin